MTSHKRKLKQRRFEPRTSSGSGLFALSSRDFKQLLSIRVKTLTHTNLVALKHIKRENGSLPVDVRRSKTELLKLPKNGRELRVAYANLQGIS